MPDSIGAPFTELIGAEIEEAGPGHSRLKLLSGRQHLGMDGKVHGGLVTALMDTSLGVAITRLRGAEARARAPHATIEMNATFFARAEEGDQLVVEGRIALSNDNIITGESEARVAATGQVLARGRLTFAVIRRPA